MKVTSSSWISLRALSTATAGSLASSSTISSIGRPSSPPAALIWSTAISVDTFIDSPTWVSMPVIGISAPILNGSDEPDPRRQRLAQGVDDAGRHAIAPAASPSVS